MYVLVKVLWKIVIVCVYWWVRVGRESVRVSGEGEVEVFFGLFLNYGWRCRLVLSE